MRVAPEIVLTNEERAELSKLVRSKRTSVRLALRARIVLLLSMARHEEPRYRVRRALSNSLRKCSRTFSGSRSRKVPPASKWVMKTLPTA